MIIIVNIISILKLSNFFFYQLEDSLSHQQNLNDNDQDDNDQDDGKQISGKYSFEDLTALKAVTEKEGLKR